MKLSTTVTNAQVLDNMMHRLGNRTSAELRGRVLYELNNRVDLLESGPTLPWFLESVHEFSTTSGVRRYTLPTGFIREPERGRLLVSRDGVALGESEKTDYDDLCLETGEPTQYALYGEWLYLGAVPNVVYDCEWNYFSESADVVDNTQIVSNPWLINAYEVTTLMALRGVAQFQIQDMDMAMRFQGELSDAKDRFWRLVEARQHSGRSYKIED
jgi:hypothetical protein